MNQGIDHISRKTGGFPLCKNRNAFMSVSIERFRADDGIGSRFCKRCLANMAKIDALEARKAAREAAAA